MSSCKHRGAIVLSISQGEQGILVESHWSRGSIHIALMCWRKHSSRWVVEHTYRGTQGVPWAERSAFDPPILATAISSPRKMTPGNLPTSNRYFAQMIRVGERIVRYQWPHELLKPVSRCVVLFWRSKFVEIWFLIAQYVTSTLVNQSPWNDPSPSVDPHSLR